MKKTKLKTADDKMLMERDPILTQPCKLKKDLSPYWMQRPVRNMNEPDVCVVRWH